MTNIDHQVQIEKDGTLVIVNPANNAQVLANIPFSGKIMKGCAASVPLEIMDVGLNTSRTVRNFDTMFSFGNFSSPNVPGVINMQQNPSLKDVGYEVQLVPGQEYPKQQYWSMFAIFTVDLSSLNPGFSCFQLANRSSEPVRLTVVLQRPWGDEPLQYVMMDEEVPLYPWDSTTFDFANVCPLTQGAAAPLAFIKKNADQTRMTGAWRVIAGTLTRTV